jgi:hypothetical protein
MICQEIKCKDYLTDEGEPAWCFMAGQPAEVSLSKCPKVLGEENGGKHESLLCHKSELVCFTGK